MGTDEFLAAKERKRHKERPPLLFCGDQFEFCRNPVIRPARCWWREWGARVSRPLFVASRGELSGTGEDNVHSPSVSAVGRSGFRRRDAVGGTRDGRAPNSNRARWSTGEAWNLTIENRNLLADSWNLTRDVPSVIVDSWNLTGGVWRVIVESSSVTRDSRSDIVGSFCVTHDTLSVSVDSPNLIVDPRSINAAQSNLDIDSLLHRNRHRMGWITRTEARAGWP